MPTYWVNAVNINNFLLGESDKVITLFTAEKGIVRAVAKGARKPGTKMSGRSDVLSVNKLFLSTGKTFEIITQAESIDGFPEFRANLERLSYALYYAELTVNFGQGLNDECAFYFEYLLAGLRLQARSGVDAAWLCLEFELGLLDLLGYRPELTYCVICREVLGDYNLDIFNLELGGIVCSRCANNERRAVAEGSTNEYSDSSWKEGVHITPLVWKNLVLAMERRISETAPEQRDRKTIKPSLQASVAAARRLIQNYIEYRAGKRMKALDLVEQIK